MSQNLVRDFQQMGSSVKKKVARFDGVRGSRRQQTGIAVLQAHVGQNAMQRQ